MNKVNISIIIKFAKRSNTLPGARKKEPHHAEIGTVNNIFVIKKFITAVNDGKSFLLKMHHSIIHSVMNIPEIIIFQLVK